MNARIHNTAMKMGVGGPKVLGARFLPPFRARAGGGSTQGSAVPAPPWAIFPPPLRGSRCSRSCRTLT